MEARLQKRVQRYGWDRAAALYERGWRGPLDPAQTLLVGCAALAEGERVLDVACGTGIVTLRAAEAVGRSGRVVGTDISEEMLRRAAATARAAGLEQVELRRMEAEELAFPDASFDAVLCALGLMYVTDAPRALREARRVLRPGGRYVAAVWGERARCGWAEIFPIVDRRVASEVCPLFFQLGTADVLERTLREAGFSDVRSARIRTELRYDSPAAALEAAFDAGPVALACSRFPEAVRRSADEEYLASIEAFRAGAGYAIPGEFVVAEGRA